MNIAQNVSLKNLNTFGIAASAEYFVEINSLDDLQNVLDDADLKSKLSLVLGGGSNILFTKNVTGLVLKNNLSGIEMVSEDENYIYAKAAAGEVWHTFVQYCISKNCAGLENLSLIPGCVGASPMQNIGAYGVEIKDLFYELEAVEIETNQLRKFTAADCEFGYRESIFKRKAKGQFIITSVTFRLNKKPDFKTNYGAITQELEKMGVMELSIQAISQAVINIRSSKLPNPKELGNAGSFFKNPEIGASQFESLKNNYADIAAYQLENGNIKLAAGWLIEQCGWKGKTVGNCGVHKNQALVIVNYGGATGSEIFNLSTEVMQSVKEKFGVELEREVNII